MTVILRRVRAQEDGNVHLWFQNASGTYIASVVGEAGNVSTRIGTPKGSREFSLVGAGEDTIRDFKENTADWKKHITYLLQKRMDIDAKVI